MKMSIAKNSVKDVFGKMIFLGVDYRHPYDADKREYDTTKIEGVTAHFGCEKMENAIDVIVETQAHLEISKFAEVEFTDLCYDPYATVTTFNSGDNVRSRGVLNERFRCKWVKEIGKPDNMNQGK